jgi:hypothetical protein
VYIITFARLELEIFEEMTGREPKVRLSVLLAAVVRVLRTALVLAGHSCLA